MRGLRTGPGAAAIVSLVMLLSLLLALPAMAFADAPPFGFQAALYAEAPQAEAHLGQSVAISGNTIVVGEPDHVETIPGVPATQVGAAYVYVRSNGQWALQQKLLPPVPWHADDQFGAAVAIDGDVVVVGAPKYYTGGPAAAPRSTGAAFVYERAAGVWGAATVLTGASAAEFAQFGSAVAIDGTKIVVGAPRDLAGGEPAGRVWPFYWSSPSWVAQGPLQDPSPVAGDGLGGSVAVEGDTIFAGSTGDTYPATGLPEIMTAGSVHRWTAVVAGGPATWVHAQTIYAPDRRAAQQFGGPIAVSQGRLMASAWNPDNGGTPGPGAVYSFVAPVGAGDWTFETFLTAPVPEVNGYYGHGLGLDGDTAVVGAFFSNSYNGRAFFYSRSSGSWMLTQQVNMVGYMPSVVQLGTSAAVSGDTAVFGAQMSSAPAVAGVGAGGAYVFKSPATFWGLVTNANTGLPVPGIEISAYVPDVYGDPELVGMSFTDPSGIYALSLPEGAYRIGWMDASDTYYPGFYNEVSLFPSAATLTATSLSSTEINLAIHPKPKVYLTTPSAPRSVRHGSRFYARGYLKPRHRAGTYPVTLYCYRYQRTASGSSAWVLRKRVRARAYDYRPRRSVRYYTRYVARLSLPYKGRWRIRAYHAADATYRDTYSGWRYIMVR